MLKKIPKALIVGLLFCNVALADVISFDSETGKTVGLPRHFVNIEKVSSYDRIASIFGLLEFVGIILFLGMSIYKIITSINVSKRNRHTNNSNWIFVAILLVAIIICSLIGGYYFNYLSVQEMQSYYNAVSGVSYEITYWYQNPTLIGMISFFGIVFVILIVLMKKERNKKIESNKDTSEEVN